MQSTESHTALSRHRAQLQRKLQWAFALFFTFAVVGSIVIGLRYNSLGDDYISYFFLGLLIFSWIGFSIIQGLESGQAVVDELQTVTLLTIDIRGFSRMSKQMGPRQTVTLLNRFFATTGEVVFRRHGMVDKYLGDGFLAVFGETASINENAENAIQAALEMRCCLAPLNRQVMTDLGTPLQMGISIHTGEVMVGHVGFEKKMDYTVIGDAVNTVFRIQGLAKAIPNGILVSGTTLGAVRSQFKVHAADVPQQARRDLGELPVYELLGHETDADDRVAGAEDESAPRASPSKSRKKPSPKLPPPVLSS